MERFPYMDKLKNFLTESLRKQTTLKKIKNPASSRIFDHPEVIVISHRHQLNLINKSKKYILPMDGVLLEDPSYQQIVGKNIVLPFPIISLEFMTTHGDYFIIFAQEFKSRLTPNAEEETRIMISSWIGDRLTKKLRWTAIHPVIFPAINPFRLSSSGKVVFPEWSTGVLTGPDADEVRRIQYWSAVTLLNFLNSMFSRVVQENKVQLNDKPIRKTSNNSDSRKEPEGNYQYITIVVPKVIKPESETKTTLEVGERFRPREHSRAGHYRYYKDGHRTWIPTNLINKGVGKAVEKKYVVKPARNFNQERSTSHEKRPNV